MTLYALIFYTLTFSFAGDPANEVIKHNMASWKHPVNFETPEECKFVEKSLRDAQTAGSLEYTSFCTKVNLEKK